MLTLSVLVLCAVVWYSARRIVKAVENQGRGLTRNHGDDMNPVMTPTAPLEVVPHCTERTNVGDGVSPEFELQLQLAAIHRVLLDGLKPDWWIKLKMMMEEFEQSPKHEDTGDYQENQIRLIERESAFAREISSLPLHAVDSTLCALAKQAAAEDFRGSRIRDIIKTGKGSVTEAELLLRQCEEADYLHSVSPRVGQQDLIEWFQENVTSASHQDRGFLELKLRDFIKANTQPKEST